MDYMLGDIVVRAESLEKIALVYKRKQKYYVRLSKKTDNADDKLLILRVFNTEHEALSFSLEMLSEKNEETE